MKPNKGASKRKEKLQYIWRLLGAINKTQLSSI